MLTTIKVSILFCLQQARAVSTHSPRGGTSTGLTVDVVQHEFEELPGAVGLVVECHDFRIHRIPFQAQDLEKQSKVQLISHQLDDH